jgi:hypothetical protein
MVIYDNDLIIGGSNEATDENIPITGCTRW